MLIPYASAAIVCEMWRRDPRRSTAIRAYEWCVAIDAASGEVSARQWVSLRDWLTRDAVRMPRCAATMHARAADCARRAAEVS